MKLNKRPYQSKNVSGKASQAARAIRRLMTNLGRPSQPKRMLLMSVVNSRLLYASPMWVGRASKYTLGTCRNLMIRAQRIAALSHEGIPYCLGRGSLIPSGNPPP